MVVALALLAQSFRPELSGMLLAGNAGEGENRTGQAETVGADQAGSNSSVELLLSEPVISQANTTPGQTPQPPSNTQAPFAANATNSTNFTAPRQPATGGGGAPAGDSGGGSSGGGGPPAPGPSNPPACTPLRSYANWSMCANGSQSVNWSDGCGGSGYEERLCGGFLTLSVEPDAILVNLVNGSGLFQVSVTANSSYGIYGAEMVLLYNASVIEAVNVTEGWFLKNYSQTLAPAPRINNSEGRMVFAVTMAGNVSGASGYGTLLSAYFAAKGAGNSTIDISGENVVENRDGTAVRIPAEVRNGTVGVA